MVVSTSLNSGGDADGKPQITNEERLSKVYS